MQNTGKNIGVMMSVVCQTRWLSFTHTHTRKQSTHRERARDKEVEQHTNISTLCNPGTSKPSPPIYLCVPVNQKAYFEHARTHAEAQTAFALCSSIQDWIGKVKDFAIDEGITRLGSLCQGGRGG